MIARIQIRRDSTTNWNSFNPILSEGEFGVEILTSGDKKIKIGDGINNWNNLDYFTASDVTYSEWLNHINNITTAHGIDQIKNSLTSGLSDTNTKIDNHINNTTNAHGINIIKNDVNELETNFTNMYQNLTLHINNNTSAHGINNIKDKIDNVEIDLNGKINTTNNKLNTVSGNLYSVSGTANSISGTVTTISGNLNTTNSNVSAVSGRIETLSGLQNTINSNISGRIENVSGLIDTKMNNISGNLYSVSGTVTTISGNLNTTNSNLNTVSGNLYSVSGTANSISGQLNTTNSNLNAISGVLDTTNENVTSISGLLNTTNTNLDNHINNNINAHGIDNIKSNIEEINIEINGIKDAIENIDIVSIKGSVDTFADLPDATNLLDGTAYIVEEDENFNGATTIYAAINGEWEFIGRFNIDLSNFYTKQEVDDLIQANIVNPSLVNSPHLWTVGTEYDFGDGSYGQRFTGYLSGAANAVRQQILLATPTPSAPNNRLYFIVDWGGSWKGGDDRWHSAGMAYTPSPWFSYLQCDFNGSNRRILFTNMSTNAVGNNNNSLFNIWIRYTK